ncbi:hypothetical protein [Streptomyces phaeoluteigriseus]|nr:hypothetical protein [Streptomyces phaeoluteigriseus]
MELGDLTKAGDRDSAEVWALQAADRGHIDNARLRLRQKPNLVTML